MRIAALWLLLLSALVLAEQAPRPKTMVDFREELKLSQTQVSELVAALKRFQDDSTTAKLKLLAAEREAASLVERRADLVEIKTRLLLMADLRYELRVLDLETSRRVETILTPEQQARWQAIQARERARRKK